MRMDQKDKIFEILSFYKADLFSYGEIRELICKSVRQRIEEEFNTFVSINPNDLEDSDRCEVVFDKVVGEIKKGYGSFKNYRLSQEVESDDSSQH